MKLSEYEKKLGWMKGMVFAIQCEVKHGTLSGAAGYLQDIETLCVELQQVKEIEDD